MKHAIIVTVAIALLTGFSTFLFAQQKTNIGLGVSYLALDAPDDMVWMPRLTYEQYIKPRLSVNISGGYIDLKKNYYFIPFNNLILEIPQSRKRIAIDATAKFSFLKLGRHQARIGAGPSLWHRDDVLVNRVSFQGTNYDYDLKRTNNWRVGANISLDYKVNITPRSSLMAHIQFVPLTLQGLNPNIGLTYFYDLRKL